MPITQDSLLTLEAYARQRQDIRAHVIPHRQLRSVQLGEHLLLRFEDETTIRYQIQEMLRVEKIFEPDGIRAELAVYNPLVPDGHNWKATLMLEYPDVLERRVALAMLVGLERKVYVELDGTRLYAVADEDLVRESADKTSSVHFLRFEFDAAQRRQILASTTLTLGVDHPNYQAHASVTGDTLVSLQGDLVA